MTIATFVVWAAWAIVLFRIDPKLAGAPALFFFYLTLSVALVGTLTILGTSVRRLTRRHDIVSRQVAVAFRQSILFSVLMISSLLLLSQSYLNIWTILLVVSLLSIVEMIFLSSRRI